MVDGQAAVSRQPAAWGIDHGHDHDLGHGVDLGHGLDHGSAIECRMCVGATSFMSWILSVPPPAPRVMDHYSRFSCISGLHPSLLFLPAPFTYPLCLFPLLLPPTEVALPTVRVERLGTDCLVVDGLQNTPHLSSALRTPRDFWCKQLPPSATKATMLRHLRVQVFAIRRRNMRHSPQLAS